MYLSKRGLFQAEDGHSSQSVFVIPRLHPKRWRLLVSHAAAIGSVVTKVQTPEGLKGLTTESSEWMRSLNVAICNDNGAMAE